MSVSDRHFSHHPLLGTNLNVSVGGVGDSDARLLDQLIVDEVERLEAILSRFRPESALERWKRDELSVVPPELSSVLDRAQHWVAITGGALDPRAGVFSELWRRSAQRGRRPDPDEIDVLLQQLRQPGFEIDTSGRVQRVGDCSALDVHGFAKGWIVDRALQAAAAATPNASVVINAGGDVARHGSGHTVVTIEDPHRPYDNAAPIDRVALRAGGLATSGNAHQGIEVDGRRYSHIIDPRTGEPANGAASVSVIADTAESADAWATALMLAHPHDVVAVAEAANVGVFAVLADRSVLANERWHAHRIAS